MKQLLITIAAVVLVGCGGESSHELLYHSIDDANIKAVEQHIATGADVNFKYSDGTTPLYIAAYYGRKEIAELLIAEGADVNAKVGDGWTPLHTAAQNGLKEIAELLIAEGTDVNAKDHIGVTPLDVAINLKRSETADLLRKHGGKTGEELKAEGK